MEYGIFNDEGLLEGGFYDPQQARYRMLTAYAEEGAHVAPVCPDHPDSGEQGSCEHCDGENE